MLFGIGIDEIEVARVKEELAKENGFKERIFTSREIDYCESKNHCERNYASRFAAKEAFLKAIGTGWRDGVRFIDIEVVNDTLGKPHLELHGKALEIADSIGTANIQVSLSHLKDIASAIVTIEKG